MRDLKYLEPEERLQYYQVSAKKQQFKKEAFAKVTAEKDDQRTKNFDPEEIDEHEESLLLPIDEAKEIDFDNFGFKHDPIIAEGMDESSKCYL